MDRRSRAGRRQYLKRRARDFYKRHAIWTCHQMAISRVEVEWRIRLLTGPDTRDLTGILLGDPRYERSALYLKTLAL
jgi:hypothetical protein